MKNQMIPLLSASLCLLGMSTAAVAAGTVNFTGTILASACDATVNGGNTVNLGTWPTSALQTAGDKTTPQPFTLSISNCAAGNYQVNFAGNTLSEDNNLLAVTGGAGQVGIRIDNAADQTVVLNTTPAQDSNALAVINSGESAAEIPLKAYYEAVGQATEGPANATVSFTIQQK